MARPAGPSSPPLRDFASTGKAALTTSNVTNLPLSVQEDGDENIRDSPVMAGMCKIGIIWPFKFSFSFILYLLLVSFITVEMRRDYFSTHVAARFSENRFDFETEAEPCDGDIILPHTMEPERISPMCQDFARIHREMGSGG